MPPQSHMPTVVTGQYLIAPTYQPLQTPTGGFCPISTRSNQRTCQCLIHINVSFWPSRLATNKYSHVSRSCPFHS